MAKNHYVTKRNRRPKNKRRKDYTAETMRKLREHADNQPTLRLTTCAGLVLYWRGILRNL